MSKINNTCLFFINNSIKHVLEKKFVCDISGKKMFHCDQGEWYVFLLEEKNGMFSCWKEKKFGQEEKHTLSPGIKCSALNLLISLQHFSKPCTEF